MSEQPQLIEPARTRVYLDPYPRNGPGMKDVGRADEHPDFPVSREHRSVVHIEQSHPLLSFRRHVRVKLEALSRHPKVRIFVRPVSLMAHRLNCELAVRPLV